MSASLTLLSSMQNKKQRMAVRAAVLRTKDPIQLIQDLELLDEQGLWNSASILVLKLFLAKGIEVRNGPTCMWKTAM